MNGGSVIAITPMFDRAAGKIFAVVGGVNNGILQTKLEDLPAAFDQLAALHDAGLADLQI